MGHQAMGMMRSCLFFVTWGPKEMLCCEWHIEHAYGCIGAVVGNHYGPSVEIELVLVEHTRAYRHRLDAAGQHTACCAAILKEMLCDQPGQH